MMKMMMMIPWKSILSKFPLFAVAAPASYGVAMFSESVYKFPINIALGLAFESVYLGAIFLAENKSQFVFLWTVIIACLTSATYNTLYAAQVAHILLQDGDVLQWLVALVHGLPLPLLSVAFSWLLHFMSDAQPVQNVQHENDVSVIAGLQAQVAELEADKQMYIDAAGTVRTEYDEKFAALTQQLEIARHTTKKEAEVQPPHQAKPPTLTLLPTSGTMGKKEEARRLRANGLSVRQIAEQLGVKSHSTVQGWLRDKATG